MRVDDRERRPLPVHGGWYSLVLGATDHGARRQRRRTPYQQWDRVPVVGVAKHRRRARIRQRQQSNRSARLYRGFPLSDAGPRFRGELVTAPPREVPRRLFDQRFRLPAFPTTLRFSGACVSRTLFPLTSTISWSPRSSMMSSRSIRSFLVVSIAMNPAREFFFLKCSSSRLHSFGQIGAIVSRSAFLFT